MHPCLAAGACPCARLALHIQHVVGWLAAHVLAWGCCSGLHLEEQMCHVTRSVCHSPGGGREQELGSGYSLEARFRPLHHPQAALACSSPPCMQGKVRTHAVGPVQAAPGTDVPLVGSHAAAATAAGAGAVAGPSAPVAVAAPSGLVLAAACHFAHSCLL